MTLVESELRSALRSEARTHQPDREAMLDRITETAMRSHLAGKRPASRSRIAGAALAVAAVLGGGGFAQWALAGDGEPVPPPPVTVLSPAPSSAPASATPSAAPSPSETETPPAKRAPKPSPSLASEPPPSTGSAAREPVRADGSVAPNGRSQGSSVVTLRTTERLTALEVTIRVARTPELVSRGGGRQVPGASVTSTVTEEPDALIYRFRLSSGDTVGPGTYTFSARYTHAAGGRDAGADSYGAIATTAAGPVTVAGAFG